MMRSFYSCYMFKKTRITVKQEIRVEIMTRGDPSVNSLDFSLKNLENVHLLKILPKQIKITIMLLFLLWNIYSLTFFFFLQTHGCNRK